MRSKRIPKGSKPATIKHTFGKTGVFKTKKEYKFFYHGRLIESKARKGLSMSTAEQMIRDNKTFKRGYKRDMEQLRNAIEITTTKAASIDNQGNLRRTSLNVPRQKILTTTGGEDIRPFQYVVSAIDNEGNRISARSQMSGRAFASTPTQMREEAWHNFFKRLDAFENGNFNDTKGGQSADGRMIYLSSSIRFKNSVREGFVAYRR